ARRPAYFRDYLVAAPLRYDAAETVWPLGDERLFRHQEEELAAGRSGRCFVVSTGTGFGKTEACLPLTVAGILWRKREGVEVSRPCCSSR
ncbi:MAG TPA: hypothetical protein VNI78_01450, partial [Vicinamibacterales bacterium]|nr:hypothetical protein [Vicinamibacterales bacterium]